MNKKYILAIMMTAVMALMSVSNLMTVDEGNTFETQAEQDYSSTNPPPPVKNQIYRVDDVKLSAGEDHTCWISAFNVVKCWGESYGPIPITIGINNATSITSGAHHSCAILVDGMVKCWGHGTTTYSSSGWVNNPSFFDQECQNDDCYHQPYYVDLGRSLLNCDDSPEGMEILASQCGDRTAVSISAGRWHTCAILDNGKIKCWGANTRGQLGNGFADLPGDEFSGSPAEIETPWILGEDQYEDATLYSAKAIAAGEHHTCALIEWRDIISLVCWGEASGTSMVGPMSYLEEYRGQDLYIKALATGGRNTCIIVSPSLWPNGNMNQSLRCWGRHSHAQFNAEDQEGNTYWSASYKASFMYDEEFQEANLWSIEVDIDSQEPIQTIMSAIHVGKFKTCVLLNDRSVKCWGMIGGTLDESTTIMDDYTGESYCLGCHGDVPYPEGSSSISAEVIEGGAMGIAVGDRYVCLIVSISVQCMGSNNYGQIGDGSYAQRNSLTPVRKSQVLSSGGSHTCAANLAINGELPKLPTCWGDNSNGQIGDNSYARGWGEPPRNLPRQISILEEYHGNWNDDPVRTDVVTHQIATGSRHSCAIVQIGSSDPEVQCWGDNSKSQVDYPPSLINTRDPSLSVNGLEEYRRPTNGYANRGYLDSASIGGNHVSNFLPISITVGYDHNCVITGDESSGSGTLQGVVLAPFALVCWGDNSYGQIGQGNTNGEPGFSNNGWVYPSSTGLKPRSVDLGTGRTAIAVDAGSYHTCAILDDQSIKCWGSNSNGQLGDGTTVDRFTPTAVDLGPGRTAREVAAGGTFTCAILDDGSVKCWGQNYRGALGDGTTTNRALPTTVNLGDDRTAISITAGGSFACAILDDGSAKCWGSNTKGQLGDRTVCRPYYFSMGSDFSNGCNGVGGKSEPTDVQLGSNERITAITAGSSHACATLYSGTVECWGNNENGQLGDGTRIDRSFPAPVKFVSISTGEHHSCAITPGGEGVRNLKCWGRATHGQLGVEFEGTDEDGDGLIDAFASGNIPYTHSPTTVNLGRGASLIPYSAVAVATGAYHTCALTDVGTVKCWGSNWYGQLGLWSGERPTAVRLTPDPDNTAGEDGYVYLGGEVGDAVPGNIVAVEISAGEYHTCATLSDDSVKCWGRNDRGQLGDGTICLSGSTDFGCNGRKGKDLPSLVDLDTQYGDVRAIEGGLHHTCAILDSGAASNPVSTYCWGSNSKGQLGCGSMCGVQSSPIAVELGGDKYPIDIDVGRYHSCAILNDGTTQCWGYNYYGQIGNGNFAFTLVDSNTGSTFQVGSSIEWTPSYVDTNREMTLVRGGGYHSCGVDTGGNLECWGRNSRGQLGDGSWATRLTPENVDGLSGDKVIDMDLGGSHTCAVLSNSYSGIGTIKCWGSNVFSQLGDGTECANSNSDPCNGDLGNNHPEDVQLELGAMIVDTQVIAGYGPPMTIYIIEPIPEPPGPPSSNPCNTESHPVSGISIICSAQQGTTGGSNSTSSNGSGNQTGCPDGTTMVEYDSLLLCISDEDGSDMLEDEEWFQNVTFLAPEVVEDEVANTEDNTSNTQNTGGLESNFFTLTGPILLGLMILLIGMYNNRKKKDDEFP